jgi:subtilisin family serine protease
LIVSFFCLKCFSATVAIIDTGADTNHPLLAENLWTNPGEIPDNGIDDDGNGYIDDVHGWNFAQDNNILKDLHGHGTHIAGLIAQNSSASRLMILKYFDPNASAQKNLASTIAAIRYATKMGAQVVNYSAGGPGFNAKEEEAIRQAEQKNILFVAAAGNDSKNTDSFKYYPANYPLENILSVLSMNRQKQISSFSNFGPHSIDIATIGEDLVSSVPGNQMAKMSGSSQATALITAAAANLIDESQNAWFDEIAGRLRQSGDRLLSLHDKSKYEKYFDANLLKSVKSSAESAYGERWANMVDIRLEEVLVPAP